MAERQSDPSTTPTSIEAQRLRAAKRDREDARARRDAELAALIESQRADQEGDPNRVYSLADARHIPEPDPKYF